MSILKVGSITPNSGAKVNITGSTLLVTTASGHFSGSYSGDGSGLSGVSGFPFTGSAAAISGSLIVTGSTTLALRVSGSSAFTGSVFVSGTVSGSFEGDGSSLTGIAGYTVANSANNRVITSVDATNANAETNLTFDGSTLGITGDATLTGTITAATGTFVYQYFESSSTIITSGSNIFGNDAADIQQITGSLLQTGSIDVKGNISASVGGFSGSFQGDGSNLTGVVASASIALTADTASIALRANTLSPLATASIANYATTIFPFFGSALFTGSLNITGSGNLALRVSGSTALTGSLLVSGSSALTGSLLVSGSSAFIGGNVGIGTTNPLGNFVVAEGTNQHGIELVPGTLSYIQAYDRGASDYGNLRIDAQKIGFGLDNGAEKVTFLANGNVGIGTTSVASGGTNTKNVQIHNSTANSTYLKLSTAGTGATAGDGLDLIVGNDGTGYLWNREDASTKFATNNAVRMSILANGNVGIGTASPTSLLHLESASSPVLTIKDTTANVTLLAYSQNDNSHIGTDSNHDLVLDTNGTERMRILANGNVGIGTTTPVATLDVSGSLLISGSTTLSGSLSIATSSIVQNNNLPGVLSYNTSSGVVSYTTGSLGGGGGGGSFPFSGSAQITGSLSVTGSAFVTSLTETSALRFKNNIEGMSDELGNVYKLRPVDFEWKDSGEHDKGLIAEEVNLIYPEFVSLNIDGTMQGIKYSKLISVLIKSVQELKDEVDSLKSKIDG